MSKTVTLDTLIIPKFDDLLRDVTRHGHTHYTLPGGRGSTKSSFVPIATLILMLMPENRDIHAIAFRKVGNTIRDSIYAQFIFAIGLLGIEHLFKFKTNPFEITYTPTGQKIYFRGLDDPMKIKSIKAPFGYFGITHFEELDQYRGREEVRNVLQSTMRAGGAKNARFWNFETFNPPISASNWANKELIVNADDPNRLIVRSTYLDVPRDWLSAAFFDEAEALKAQNERAYRHEYLGEPTGTGLNVFENLEVRPITDDELKTFDNLYYGLDWGFIHPAHFSESYFNPNRRELYIFGEKRWVRGRNEDIARDLDAYKGIDIICDSAEPRSVADLQAWGFRGARKAEKGVGSLNYGMKWLQSLNKIIIDERRCPFTAQEFLEYEYERDKDGNPYSAYPNVNDDAIAAVRYSLERVWKWRGE